MDIEQERKKSMMGNRAIAASGILSIGGVVLLCGACMRETQIGKALCILSAFMLAVSAVLFYININESKVRLPKVIGWTKWNDSLLRFEDSGDGMLRYEDAEQAVINEIRKRKYKFGGKVHDPTCKNMDGESGRRHKTFA